MPSNDDKIRCPMCKQAVNMKGKHIEPHLIYTYRDSEKCVMSGVAYIFPKRQEFLTPEAITDDSA